MTVENAVGHVLLFLGTKYLDRIIGIEVNIPFGLQLKTLLIE